MMVKDGGDGTSQLSPQAGNFNDLLFAKDFCFVQTADGKIADVIYPQGDNIQVANIKKSIVSAFQANFRKDSAREEMDVSGAHRASYRFVVCIHAMSLYPWIDICLRSLYMITKFLELYKNGYYAHVNEVGNQFLSLLFIIPCCRYHSSAAGALSYTRTVTSSDVLYIAGVPDDLRLTNFDKEETASFDSSNTLQLAQGNMHVSLASLSSAQPASDWSRRR